MLTVVETNVIEVYKLVSLTDQYLRQIKCQVIHTRWCQITLSYLFSTKD